MPSLRQGRHFVVRLGSHVRLYADFEVRGDFSEGRVYLWPITKLVSLEGERRKLGVSFGNSDSISHLCIGGRDARAPRAGRGCWQSHKKLCPRRRSGKY